MADWIAEVSGILVSDPKPKIFDKKNLKYLVDCRTQMYVDLVVILQNLIIQSIM